MGTTKTPVAKRRLQKPVSSKARGWITEINRNFRVQVKLRGDNRYQLIGAGTVVKLVDENTAFLAFLSASQSKWDIVPFDVKNRMRFKFYSK